jgi:hypothetical protein
MSTLVTVLFQLAIGVLLIYLGRRVAPRLASTTLLGIDETFDVRRAQLIRRGGIACQVAGVVFVLMIAPLLF